MKLLLSTLACCVALASAKLRKEDNIDALIDELIKKDNQSQIPDVNVKTKEDIIPRKIFVRQSSSSEIDKESPNLGSVSIQTVSKDFEKAFNIQKEDDAVDLIDQSPRKWFNKKEHSGHGACLRDHHVSRMADCLAEKFCDRRFKDRIAKKYLRKYIHKKNVKAWFYYVHHCFGVKLSVKNIVKVVQCYINEVPT